MSLPLRPAYRPLPMSIDAAASPATAATAAAVAHCVAHRLVAHRLVPSRTPDYTSDQLRPADADEVRGQSAEGEGEEEEEEDSARAGQMVQAANAR
jgi:hypothetical protein